MKSQRRPDPTRCPCSTRIVRSGLETVDRGLEQILELRAFGGFAIEEAARVLKVSPSTAKREWPIAKALLTRELGAEHIP